MTTKTEAARARQWREARGLSVQRLVELTGYSQPSIYWFEQGRTPPQRNAKGGRPNDRRPKKWVWHRYKLACAAVDYALSTGKTFNW